jgi:hypothetical protein
MVTVTGLVVLPVLVWVVVVYGGRAGQVPRAAGNSSPTLPCIDTCIDTGYAFGMADMRIVEDATTPTGEAGFTVECDCKTHPAGRNRAVLRGVARDGIAAHPDRIHGFVTLAHHPVLSKAPKIRAEGPWAA